MTSFVMRLQSPLRDRRGRISALKATAFVLIAVVPSFAILWPWMTDSAGGDPSILLTYTTGTWSCWLFVLSLTVTPFRRIFGWSQLITIRRMLGVGGVVYTLAHVVVFFWLIHYDAPTFRMETTRPTIWVATAATLGLLVLAATSLDAATAKMGVWWNRLHTATYVLIGAALLHFLLSRASTAGVPFLLAGVFFWLMAWRVLDRFRKGASLAWLFGLAFAVTGFSVGFEVVWLYLYRGRALWRTFIGEFTLGADFFSPFPATGQLFVLAVTVPIILLTVRRLRNPPILPVLTVNAPKPLSVAGA